MAHDEKYGPTAESESSTLRKKIKILWVRWIEEFQCFRSQQSTLSMPDKAGVRHTFMTKAVRHIKL
jgi:hypothetical protein